MNLQRRELIMVGLIGLVLLVVVALSAVFGAQSSQDRLPTLSTLSTASDGGRAFYLWLKESNYPVSVQSLNVFTLSAKTKTVLMFEPVYSVEEDEWKVLDAWVEKGGTLMVVGDSIYTGWVFNHFDCRISFFEFAENAPNSPSTYKNPVLPWITPPFTEEVDLQPVAYFSAHPDDGVVHWSVSNRPTLISFDRGKGRVVLSTLAYPLTNAGLRTTANAQFGLNMVALSRGSGEIWFDEWHHGERLLDGAAPGLNAWLFQMPTGRALVFVFVVLMLTFWLRGWNFGRPLKPLRQMSRRAPLEYITAMSNLTRRAGHRDAEARYYRFCLKRALGRRYRLDPGLPDDEYVARWVEFNPQRDAEGLRRLLRRLQQHNISEHELVQLAGEVSKWIKE